jgi:hypothetical protein
MRKMLALIGISFGFSCLLTGCGIPPKITDESSVFTGVTRKMERALIVVPHGVLDGMKTFGRPHAEYIAMALQAKLADENIQSQSFFPRVTDIQRDALQNALKSLQPTHILQISPVRSTISNRVPSSVEWLVQVQQAERPDGTGSFKTVYKMTILTSLCVTGASLGEAPQKACFDAIVTPMVSAFHSRGL